MATRRRPPSRDSRAIERSYSIALRRHLAGFLRTSTDAALRALRQRPRQDAEQEEDEEDRSHLIEDVRNALEPSHREVDEVAEKAKPLAAKAVRRTANKQAEGFVMELGEAFDPKALSKSKAGLDAARLFRIDPFKSEPWLERAMEQAVSEHVALVKSLERKHLADLENLVHKGVREGRRVEDIAFDVAVRYGVSQRRAELIAQDQVGKFYGRLDEERQTRLGVTEYTWRTSKDEKVRPDHRRREGKVFKWKDPPSDGHPGQAIRCRCYPEPKLPEFEEALAEAPMRPPVRVPAKPIPAPSLTKLPLAVPDLGVKMERSPRSKLERERVVVADLEALVRSLEKDPNFFVGPGGRGEISGRVTNAMEFLERARREGIAVHMSQLGIKPNGEASVRDGRHRLEVYRRLGIKEVPVSVDRGSYKSFAEKFGVRLPRSIRPVPSSAVKEERPPRRSRRRPRRRPAA